jgi:hypothetical protein
MNFIEIAIRLKFVLNLNLPEGVSVYGYKEDTHTQLNYLIQRFSVCKSSDDGYLLQDILSISLNFSMNIFKLESNIFSA